MAKYAFGLQYDPYKYLNDYSAYDSAMAAGASAAHSLEQKWSRLYGQPQPEPETPKFTTDHFTTLDIAFLTADDVTVAQLTSPAPHHKVYRGAAKRHGDDKENPSVGGSLALARLLRNYADALEKEALRLSRL